MNTKSATNAREFVHVLSRDDKGRPTRLLVPGHEGRLYKVDLERNGKLEATCRQVGESGTVFYADCKGAQRNICYHILAACMVAAEEQGKEVRWCVDERHAKQLTELWYNQSFSVKSAQSGKTAWGVTRSDKTGQVETGMSKNALIALALRTTGDKMQWFTGETVWLADDAFLKNDGDIVRLYRAKKPRALAVVYRLNFRANCWEPQAQLTPAQAETELFERDSAIPVQYERGRGKLLKT